MTSMLQAAYNELALVNSRQREEIERLRTLSQNNAISWDACVRERDELREKVKKLELELVELDER